MSESFKPIPAGSWETHTRWAVEIGGLRLAVVRTRQGHGHGHGAARWQATASRPALPFLSGVLATAGALVMVVAGATAATRIAPPERYELSLPVPTAAGSHGRTPRHPRARIAPARAVRSLDTAEEAAGQTEALPFGIADAPFIARAMHTGAFQEWSDSDGGRRFLTASPARVVNGRFCRALALMIRPTEGGSHVRTLERCTDGPISDVMSPPDAPQGDAPGNGD